MGVVTIFFLGYKESNIFSVDRLPIFIIAFILSNIFSILLVYFLDTLIENYRTKIRENR
jgi:hypothetical protein